MHDIVIRGGTTIDGTGHAARCGMRRRRRGAPLDKLNPRNNPRSHERQVAEYRVRPS
jgi:hypothetical protein